MGCGASSPEAGVGSKQGPPGRTQPVAVSSEVDLKPTLTKPTQAPKQTDNQHQDSTQPDRPSNGHQAKALGHVPSAALDAQQDMSLMQTVTSNQTHDMDAVNPQAALPRLAPLHTLPFSNSKPAPAPTPILFPAFAHAHAAATLPDNPPPPPPVPATFEPAVLALPPALQPASQGLANAPAPAQQVHLTQHPSTVHTEDCPQRNLEQANGCGFDQMQQGTGSSSQKELQPHASTASSWKGAGSLGVVGSRNSRASKPVRSSLATSGVFVDGDRSSAVSADDSVFFRVEAPDQDDYQGMHHDSDFDDNGSHLPTTKEEEDEAAHGHVHHQSDDDEDLHAAVAGFHAAQSDDE